MLKIALLVSLLVGCTDDSKARRALEGAGYP